MQYLRRTLLSVVTMVVAVSLLGFATLSVVGLTIRDRDTVKAWIDRSGFYDELTDSLMEQLKSDGQSNLPEDVNVDSSEVGAIVGEVFHTGLLKDTTEQIVDGLYTWLSGETPEDSVKIDLRESKRRLADSFGVYAAKRMDSLPLCTPVQIGVLSVTIDPMTVQCKPPNVDTAPLIMQTRDNVLDSLSFLPDEYSDMDKVISEQTNQTSWLSILKGVYDTTAWLPYVLLVLAIAGLTVIVLMSSTRKRGLFRSGSALIMGGIVLAALSLIVIKTPEYIMRVMGSAEGQGSAGLDMIGDLVIVAGKDMGSMLWWFIIPCLLIGVSMVIYARNLPGPGSFLPRRGVSGGAQGSQQKQNFRRSQSTTHDSNDRIYVESTESYPR